MKILIVCQFYYPENFVIYKIAETLKSFGHDVHVLTGKPNYGYGYILPEYKHVIDEEINGVKVHRVNLYPRKDSRISIIKNYLSFWKNSKKWVEKTKIKFDVVYSMSLSPVTILAAGNLYKKKYGVPHVCHCVDLWPESVLVTNAVKEGSLAYRILYHWSKKLYEGCDRILVGSPSFKDYFVNKLKMSGENIVYIPQPSLVDDSESIKPYSLGEGFNILYCGNLGRIQLVEMIPNAMKLVKNPDVRFHVIGMGPMTNEFLKRIADLKLANKVIYHGPLPAQKAAPYFKSADALFVSLKSEGVAGKTIPNKLIMSMAFSKPILGMLEGDGKDVLKKSGGAIFADQNEQSLAEAIQAISTVSSLTLKKLGALNRAYYEDNFELEKVVREIEKYLI